jgi:hypothetical protein
MLGVRVIISRWVDDAQPGWVECQFTDAHGCVWSFVEKLPVVTPADLDASSRYPQPGVIACQVVGRGREPIGREVVSIDTSTPWHVESTSGQTRFDVLPEQLMEFDWGGAAGP